MLYAAAVKCILIWALTTIKNILNTESSTCSKFVYIFRLPVHILYYVTCFLFTFCVSFLWHFYFYHLFLQSFLDSQSLLTHSIISLTIDLRPHCSEGPTVCCQFAELIVPFKGQGEVSACCVGGEHATNYEGCVSKLPQTAEVKQSRLTLQSWFPWESMRRQWKIHATPEEEKKRSERVIEHS